MRQIKALFGAALALALTACSNPQYLLHPFSSPAATEARQKVDVAVDTTMLKPMVWGSFLAPAKGAFFKPVLPTDSRNAVIYIYRPQTAWNDQEIQAPGFFLNGRFLSGLKSGSYFWFEIPSGTYYLHAKRPFTFFYLNTIFEGGKSYFFRYDEEHPGPKKPAKGAALLVVGPLQQMPDAQGQSEVAQTRAMGAGSMLMADQQPQWAPFDFYSNAQTVPESALDAASSPPSELKPEEGNKEAERSAPASVEVAKTPGKHWWNVARRP